MQKLMLCVGIFASQFFTMDAKIHKNKRVITTDIAYDGFGAQIQQIIANFVYADLNNIEFCYRPFDKMEHNYNNDPDFITKKEQLVNLRDNVLTIDEAQKRGYRITSMNLLKFFDNNIDKVAPSLKKLKRIFGANKNVTDYLDKNNFNIAVHIRRYLPDDTRLYGSDIPDDFYIQIIDKLRTKYNAKNPVFHIYSTGTIENFEMYKAPDVIFHLNEPLEKTYPGMVFADILVAGRSALSYTAGYLSDGIVYYHSFSHAALPDWIPVEDLFQDE